MVPDKLVNQIFLYALAVACKRYSVKVHCAVVMSNHWHAVLTDVDAQLPRFAHFVHSTVARAINAYRGRWEGFWSPSQRYSSVQLGTPEDIADKVLYVLLNPVRAGLVSENRSWPGLNLNPLLQRRYVVERPAHFFRADNRKLPQSITLELEPLPGQSEDDLVALGRRLKEEEASVRSQFRREGRTFKGAGRVMKEKWQHRAKAPEKRRGLDPHIACRDKDKRIAAIESRARFLLDYGRALHDWMRGKRRVVFPAGTYHMRVCHRALCQPSGP